VADGAYGTTYSSLFGALAGCYDWKFTGNKVTVRNASMGEVLFFDTAMSGVTSNNDFHIDTAGPTGSVQGVANVSANTYNHFYHNSWVMDTIQTGASVKVGSGQATEPALITYPLPQTSGNIGIFSQYDYAGIFSVALTGNISSVNLGSARVPGLRYALSFTQPSSGGPYTIPSTCGNSGWITSGTGIDCGTNGPPSLNPAASSTTTIWLYDDGTTVHLVSTNYTPPALTNTGAAVGVFESAVLKLAEYAQQRFGERLEEQERL